MLRQLIFLSMVSVIFMILLLRGMASLEKRKEEIKNMQLISEKKEKIFSVPLLAVIAICIVMVTIIELGQ